MMGKKHKILLWGAMSTVMISVFGVVVDGDASALTYSSQHDIEFTFNSVISINLSSPNLVISDLAPGEYSDSNTITVGANTNASMGYQLSATVGQKNGTDALVNTTSSSNTFANLTTTQATLAGFSDNTWGYSYCADTSTNCGTSGSGTWVSGSKGSTTAGYAGLPLDNNDNATERGNGGVLLLNTSGPEDTVQSVQFKIGAKASTGQASGDYTNTINFYAVANPEPQLGPVACEAGKICYNKNALSGVEGTMGQQSEDDSNNNITNGSTVTLLASNFSRNGYGFAGWNTAYDYSGTNYGPNETITTPANTSTNGLSLYAIWVKSIGSLQNWSGCSSLPQGSVTALTDQRDNNTYAIAKLADGKCWMIENLRLDNSATLTTVNTNNPLNDSTNVTLKHNYSDTETYNTLSASQDPTATAWCSTTAASCDDQSMLFTGNTTNRKTDSADNTGNIYSYGNYYNWYSATAGNGTYSFSTKNNSVAGDLCPTGWHLPKGGSGTTATNSDFWQLGLGIMGAVPSNNSYYQSSETNAAGKTATAAYRSYPNNFVYSGNVYSGSVNSRGSSSIYWSSSAYSSSMAYYLLLATSSRVYPGTDYNGKYSGLPVRCVVSGV